MDSDHFFASTDAASAHDLIAFQNSGTFFPPGTDLTYKFGVAGYGWAGGVVGCAGIAMTRLLGPYSTFAGVHGTAQDFTGVAGTSVNHVGVYGQVETDVPVVDGLHAGVLGTALTQPGVIGISEQSSDGVQGFALDGSGVLGESSAGPGITGVSTLTVASGVRGVSGTEGPPAGMGLPAVAGVLGTARFAPGVIGTSEDFMGVYGFSTLNAGVVGETTNPQSFAGYFAGRVRIAGNLEVAGQITADIKDAIVPFPDGSKRVLHCMESPEHWFEDFGAAKLKRGRAVVTLDADFAKVIKRGDYHIFLTPRGDCRGLYVRRQGGASFEVRELARGTSSVAFSYRVVGHRKDIKRHKRFAKIDTALLRLPAARGRRPPTRRAFIADIEKRGRAKATPAMRESDRKVAAMPPADLQPRRSASARSSG
jgi:hypothetical protein